MISGRPALRGQFEASGKTHRTKRLPKVAQAWRNVFTGKSLAPVRGEDGVMQLEVGKVLAGYPVGLLVNEASNVHQTNL